MNTHIQTFSARAIVLLLLATTLTACSSEDKQAKQAPEPIVSVITVRPQVVAMETALIGRLEASRKAEIRARVPGVLQKHLFVEGSEVKSGQALFTIDDGPYRAALMTARANFTKAKADMNRMRPLMEAGAISKQEWDAIVQLYQVSQANLDTANINMGYAHVTAPISGRIGRAIEPEGALVGQGAPTLLAVIQQTDPLYINLTQSADEVMKMRAALAAGELQGAGDQINVTISFKSGEVYPLSGKLLFIDPTVSETTGQVSLRAEVPNPDGVLFPGLFVKVHFAQTEVPNAVLIPQEAVTRGAQGDSVVMLNADGTYGPRAVNISGEQDNQWIISSGLKAGEQVIVDGLMTAQMMQAKKLKGREWSRENAAKNTASQAEQTSSATSGETDGQQGDSADNTASETTH